MSPERVTYQSWVHYPFNWVVIQSIWICQPDVDVVSRELVGRSKSCVCVWENTVCGCFPAVRVTTQKQMDAHAQTHTAARWWQTWLTPRHLQHSDSSTLLSGVFFLLLTTVGELSQFLLILRPSGRVYPKLNTLTWWTWNIPGALIPFSPSDNCTRKYSKNIPP